jgi:hypothetical protein
VSVEVLDSVGEKEADENETGFIVIVGIIDSQRSAGRSGKWET